MQHHRELGHIFILVNLFWTESRWGNHWASLLRSPLHIFYKQTHPKRDLWYSNGERDKQHICNWLANLSSLMMIGATTLGLIHELFISRTYFWWRDDCSRLNSPYWVNQSQAERISFSITRRIKHTTAGQKKRHMPWMGNEELLCLAHLYATY